MTIMQWGAIVWLITAAGGLTMGLIRLSGTPRPPTWIAVVHGIAAVVGLFLIGWAAIVVSEGARVMENVALGMGGLAAIGGVTLMLGFHARAKPLPPAILIAHGIAGAAATFIALFAAFADVFPRT